MVQILYLLELYVVLAQILEILVTEVYLATYVIY